MVNVKSITINELREFKKRHLNFGQTYLLQEITRLEDLLEKYISSTNYFEEQRVSSLEYRINTLAYLFKHYYIVLHKIDRQITLLETRHTRKVKENPKIRDWIEATKNIFNYK